MSHADFTRTSLPARAPVVCFSSAPRVLSALCALSAATLGSPAPAPAWKTFAWSAEEGLATAVFRIPSGGDGTVELADLAGRKALRTAGAGSFYIYFDLLPAIDAARLYVTVEYLDRGVGQFGLQYDSRQDAGGPPQTSYRHAEASWGAMCLDSGQWRTAAFELHRPLFRGRQNHGADFRLAAMGGLAISRLTVSDAPPPDYARLQAAAARDVPVMVRPAEGVEITIGGYDSYDTTRTAAWRAELDQALPLLRAVGATSHETYVVWSCCQPTPLAWDWSHYDACVEAHRKAGLKWVPFVILGPSYTLPKWYYDSKEHVGYRCLEHGEATAIQSLWQPDLPSRVEVFIKAFADRYGRAGVIESVLLGITGNYGEAIYPATGGNEWTARLHGRYHSHPGMWCGDEFAVRDFRRWLQGKYATLDKLNAAWAASHGDWGNIQPVKAPPAKGAAGSPRPWLDTVDWYRDAMNRWADLWLAAAVKHLPRGTEVYLCTGGHAPPQHGSEFGVQSKLAARRGAGVRITNEASDYAANFAITRWVASACRFYGTFFGYEPAGGVDPRGVVARIYNATASGARQLHHYPNNILDRPEAMQAWRRFGSMMKPRKPKVDLAVWYPNRMVDLMRGDVWTRLRQMREVCDYDFVDDRMILDGALDRYGILVCISDGPYEQPVLAKVDAWVRGGRRLFVPAAEGFWPRAVEGDKPVSEGWRELANVRRLPCEGNLDGYWDALRKELPPLGIVVTGIRGVYATAFHDGSLLVLNMTDRAQKVSLPRREAPVSIEPASILEVP